MHKLSRIDLENGDPLCLKIGERNVIVVYLKETTERLYFAGSLSKIAYFSVHLSIIVSEHLQWDIGSEIADKDFSIMDV